MRTEIMCINNFLLRICFFAWVLLCLYICFVQHAFAMNDVYFYEPMSAELEGTIAYKQIDCHCGEEDKDFRNLQNECVFLLLDKPIDIKKPGNGFAMQLHYKKNSITEKNIEILQISNEDNIDPYFNIGDRVRVKGGLYRHFRNCDHSRVLIDIVDLEVIDRSKRKF
jgi:hypothetical protein